MLPILVALALAAMLRTGTGLAQEEPATRSGQPRNGQAAIVELEDRIGTVASRHGLSTNQLRSLFLRDSTLWVSASGALYYVDPPYDDPGSQADGPTAPDQSSLAPLNQTFLLHSKPGSNRIIYLDFNGHVVTGTLWAGGSTLNAPPFSIDGSATFSNAELERIQHVWAMVAEDYAPFDVDITTEEPPAAAITRSGPGDQQYGTRVVITPSQEIHNAVCDKPCGGIAFVGAFDLSAGHATQQPAWVFNSESAKSIAEAISHEVGHTLGLSHDGATGVVYYTGHGLWAPIMGTAYTRPLGQWSAGEYPGATNTEDDIAIMATHGALPRSDDHGDTTNTATDLGDGPSFTVNGLIHSRTDVDVFRIDTHGGFLEVTANPAPLGGNLDIRLELRDAQGALVAWADPPASTLTADRADGVSASLHVPVGTATYYLVVDGVGFGTLATGYSDYGSVGQYTLSGSFPDGQGTCFSLTVNIDPPGSGTVSMPAQNCPGGYLPGSKVTVTPQGTGDFKIHHWTGDIESVAKRIDVGMSSNRIITAHFSTTCVPNCTVAQLVSPADRSVLPGSVVTFTWTPGEEITTYALRLKFGIPNEPPDKVTSALSVQVTGIPTDGRTISALLWGMHPTQGWSIHGEYQFTAATPNCRSLVHNVSPPGSGTVSISPDPSCPGGWPNGTQVQVTAQPGPGYEFAGWSGDLTGAEHAKTLMLTAPKSVVASFTVAGDHFANPVAVAGVDHQVAIEATHASTAASQLTLVQSPACDLASALFHDVWFTFTAPAAGTLRISVAGSDPPSGIVALNAGATEQHACAGTTAPSAGTRLIDTQPGDSYAIAAGTLGAAAQGKLRVRIEWFATGDATCDHSVDGNDALQVLMELTGLATAVPNCNSDSDGSGEVDISDAVLSARKAANLG